MAYKCKIRESPRDGSRISEMNVIPTDSKKLFSTRSYDFYFYKKGKKKILYIRTSSYHPGQLEIPLKELEELIQYLEVE